MSLATQISMFGYEPQEEKRKRMTGEVLEITSEVAKEFLLPRHYSGRIPSISKAYGLYVKGELKAVCTFGKPASNSLCVGVCGAEYADRVYELNRLCREDDFREPLSAFVSACLRRLRTMRWIIVSYSDTAMNHHGYIYQACNFLYTGATKERTDIFTGGEAQQTLYRRRHEFWNKTGQKFKTQIHLLLHLFEMGKETMEECIAI